MLYAAILDFEKLPTQGGSATNFFLHILELYIKREHLSGNAQFFKFYIHPYFQIYRDIFCGWPFMQYLYIKKKK